jgi:hypothetical protein
MDLLDVFEHAGYKRGDDVHTGRAIGLLWDAARIYAQELDQPEAVPATPLVVRGLAKAEAARKVAVPADEISAAAQLAEIRVVLGAFDWSTDDRQYALEQVEQIANGAVLPAGPAQAARRIARGPAGVSPGRAAHDAWWDAMPPGRRHPDYAPYDDEPAENRGAWDAAAQAAIATDDAGRGDLAAQLDYANGHCADLRELVLEILAAFDPSKCDGYRARAGQVQIAKWRQHAGLEAER